MCTSCRDTGLIFTCPLWATTHGMCCPAGSIEEGCPGKSVPCPSCAPRLSLMDRIWNWLASLPTFPTLVTCFCLAAAVFVGAFERPM